MIKYATWTITVLLLLGYSTAYYLGAVDYLIETDVTMITFAIATLTLLTSLAANWMTFHKRYPTMLYKHMDMITVNLPGLGMTGTVCGVMIAMFADGVTGGQLMKGTSIALTTTLAGLAGFLVCQLIMIQVDEAKRHDTEK